jgi:hypothetical protein
MKKIIVRSICIFLAAILFAVGGYVLYVVFSYHRIEDNLALSVEGDGTGEAPLTKNFPFPPIISDSGRTAPIIRSLWTAENTQERFPGTP